MDLPVTLLNAFNSSFSTTIFESEYLKTHRLFSASSHTNHHILFGSSKTDWKSSRKLLNYCRRFFIYTSVTNIEIVAVDLLRLSQLP